MAWTKDLLLGQLHFDFLCLSIDLTATVLGMDGVTMVTGLAHLAVGATCVGLATETCPRDDITVPRLTQVHIAVALAADTGPTHFLWISVKAASAPGEETDGWSVKGLV